MINWKEKINKFYEGLIYSGIFIVGIYLIFKIIASFVPFFENRFIFQLFDVGHETNVPTYFSVLLYFFLGVFSWLIGQIENGKGKSIAPWIFTMFLFFFLGLDELASLHEQLTYHTQRFLGAGGFLAFAWTIPYLLAILMLSIFYIPFVWRLKHGKIIFVGAVIFISGAIGFEMIGSHFYEKLGVESFQFMLASSFEEIFEITGLLVAIYAFKEELFYRT